MVEVLAKVVLNEHGAIANGNTEQFALMLADGIKVPDAWKTLGHTNDKSSYRYRTSITRHPIFKQRVQDLMEEKAAIREAGGPFAEAEIAIRTCYQTARAQNDLSQMAAMARLMFQMADKQAPGSGKGVDPDAAPRGPGRPTIESPQTKGSPSGLRTRLLELGRPAPPQNQAETVGN